MAEARSDLQLLEAWGDGDQSAGRALVERHFDAVHRFFRNKVEQGIEDLVQQTLLACVEGRARIRDHASFRSYLLQIARHQLYNHYRSRRRSKVVDFSVSSVVDLADTPSRVLVREEDARLLLEALRRIPLDSQVVLELYFWDDLTGPEMAAVLEVPEATVRSRVRRALERLRRELEDLLESGGVRALEADDLEGWARRVRGEL